ncbi:hypothetical protein LTS02_000659 [Friedmanniomyces endolithicus]|uniref:DNA polymerase delta subunit 3 n=1 Tax=Friedmanniomyces endolithicus TaxID=329885 RepID=A0A4U0V0S4_9PEZI|nr:hypothetical protein LTS09_000178 [Friedmanniomyces endolithicus]KAK0357125.1 hypothetical protein LTR94_001678 [Friedmanniomyces endolithicus]KAK0800026.1 hypothetical protein LTR75_009062 [Friedmanniomyces endolithicus]KAK0800875.1 hypothetical protein LTR38_007041 [Friedmanniomyces endolithicus]KAK0808053.1 hypothetical protein LTR59_003112 [Friedmanniomyces endolithicus]
MAQDYTEWLAINVLNEQQLVSYRSLSRALKVHSNLAKQMLYDFHRNQNAKKPGTVHATYLITGVKQTERPATNGMHSQRDGEDTVMQSSPLLPSSSALKPDEHDDEEPNAVQTVMLVKQESLDLAKAKFESITGLHIYSLQAKGLGDIQSLTECNRKIAVDYASEDPMEVWKQYGTIQNPNVKRRTQRRQPPPPPAPVAKAAVAKAKPPVPTAKPTTLKKEASKDSEEAKPASNTCAKATTEPAKKPPTNKRQSSDIFKSFAKGKPKAKTEQESQESAGSTPKPAPDDEPIAGFSDEEDADEGDAAVIEEAPKVVNGKSKKEREAELQAMMEQDDEVMEDAAGAEPESAEADVDEGAIDKPETQAEEPKETVQIENGRRRGRRRVMKKKTVKDEDGYLVTKEEATWESFSEDEPAPKRIKVPPTTSMSKSTTAAAGKKGARPGGGNIMSFFSKK